MSYQRALGRKLSRRWIASAVSIFALGYVSSAMAASDIQAQASVANGSLPSKRSDLATERRFDFRHMGRKLHGHLCKWTAGNPPLPARSWR